MLTEKDYSNRQTTNILVDKFLSLGIDGRIDWVLMFYVDENYRSKRTEEQIDILRYVNSGYYPRLMEKEDGRHERERDLFRETLDIIVEEGLATTYNTNVVNYVPTALGHRINERGGWLKHVEREEANRTLAASVNKSVITTNKVQWIAAGMTIVIIGFSAWITWENNTISREELMLRKQELQDKQIQKSLQEKAILYQNNVDSLSQIVDTLRRKLSERDTIIKKLRKQ